MKVLPQSRQHTAAESLDVCSGKSGMIGKSLCPVFVALGFVCVGLGFVGVIVPGMPTTIFLILAVWCFSRGSDRCRSWLMTHPKFGPTLQAWHETRSIPMRAKWAAVLSMAGSLVITKTVFAVSWLFAGVLAGVLVAVAVWIVTRPTAIPVRI